VGPSFTASFLPLAASTKQGFGRRETIKLLLAVDFTESADEIVGAVAARPWPKGTLAHVLTAIEYAAIPAGVWRAAAGRIDRVRQEMQRKADLITTLAVKRLRDYGIAAQPVVKIDDARFAIVKEATSWPAQLILLRAHTQTDLTRWLLGSVTNAVLHDAPCSVEVVRATVRDAKRFAQSGLKILFATDGSECSSAAGRSVAERPWPRGSEIKVITVIEPQISLLIGKHGELERGPHKREEAQTMIAEAERAIADAGLRVTSELREGNPKEEITEYARSWNADLVVVGSHGRRGLKRWLLGSVSEAVATHAPCSVEVIRVPGNASR
jgi:nucleotide-binding universal stress UspA family protein